MGDPLPFVLAKKITHIWATVGHLKGEKKNSPGVDPLCPGRERLAAGGAGGHGEEAGGGHQQAGRHPGGEEAVALHGTGQEGPQKGKGRLNSRQF